MKFDLKNHGQVPAINLRASPVIAQHPGNPRRKEIDPWQQAACDSVRKQADEDPIGGIAVFPGESTSVESASALSGIYTTDNPILFSVYGCVDYSYGNARHGQTGFRMLLGKVIEGQVFGLPFIEGTVREKVYSPAPELLAHGFPAEAPKEGLLQPGDFFFGPDDAGNYAK